MAYLAGALCGGELVYQRCIKRRRSTVDRKRQEGFVVRLMNLSARTLMTMIPAIHLYDNSAPEIDISCHGTGLTEAGDPIWRGCPWCSFGRGGMCGYSHD